MHNLAYISDPSSSPNLISTPPTVQLFQHAVKQVVATTGSSPLQPMAASESKPPSPAPAPYLPLPFSSNAAALQLITQGAEAHLYKTTFLSASRPVALKIRPKKQWRHAILDKRLTRSRILAEARVLAKCLREDVRVPAVLALDADDGWLIVEWIHGVTVKQALRERKANASTGTKETGGEDMELRALLRRVGAAVGKLHAAGIIHGDLTTSNMMVEPQVPQQQEESRDKLVPGALAGEIVLIDFGLATQAVQEEERAVDLYVLERAFGSTHPREEALFGEVLAAYEKSYKGARITLKRLEDVRMRGRKKEYAWLRRLRGGNWRKGGRFHFRPAHATEPAWG
ncbi:hypothetical protein MRB53_039973 [Persea americana]|nr:hypothetical protein MRB53_039973 [Persea americana]